MVAHVTPSRNQYSPVREVDAADVIVLKPYAFAIGQHHIAGLQRRAVLDGGN